MPIKASSKGKEKKGSGQQQHFQRTQDNKCRG